jgi:hypothetical protein
MKGLCLLFLLLLFSNIANAEMVASSSIGNDPEKEKLCISRAQRSTMSKAVPFVIDSDFVARARSYHSDATFIAVDDGMSPQLIECFLREGTGRFEPNSFSPEQHYWHTIKPQQFDPGMNTVAGPQIAAKICMKRVQETSDQNSFDHIVYNMVIEVPLRATGTAIRAGTLIGGKKSERYDVVVKGTSFYKSSSPDLKAVGFTCLLSPMFEVKAIELKK